MVEECLCLCQLKTIRDLIWSGLQDPSFKAPSCVIPMMCNSSMDDAKGQNSEGLVFTKMVPAIERSICDRNAGWWVNVVVVDCRSLF